MIRDQLIAALADSLDALGVEAPESIGLERPTRPEHGDWSSNVAMATAKKAGRNPRELAGEIVERLSANPPAHVTAVEIAGPGFVNFRLAPTWLHDVLVDVISDGEESYGRLDMGGGQKVNVEFVSANPTGPLHAGGGRWAAYGDALCNILERCGYDTHREYYLNDRGNQMQLFADSLLAAKNGEAAPEGGYAGEYISEWAEEMPSVANAKAWGYERVKTDLRKSLSRMGVEFDTWFSEQSLVDDGSVDATLAKLLENGSAYEKDGAVWLKTQDFGDDQDRVLVKSDGDPTYLLPDLAYHDNKFERGFDRLLDVWGADHHGYVNRLKAGVAGLGHDPESLELILGQMVSLERDGQPVKIGKRSGNLITVDDVVELVGRDVARFVFLLQSIDTAQTIDLAKVEERSMENPVYYVQMANARIHSIFRVATERGVARRPLAEVDLGLLADERELDVLRSLFELPKTLEAACTERAPHKVTNWVRELAGAFHSFYHHNPVLKEGVPDDVAQARMWLAESARIGLAIGLSLLGASAPEQM